MLRERRDTMLLRLIVTKPDGEEFSCRYDPADLFFRLEGLEKIPGTQWRFSDR